MTSPIQFNSSARPLTLGAEMELQLLDSKTYDLKASSLEVLKRITPTTKIHAELFQSMLEINSGICRDAHELEQDFAESVARLRKVTDELELKIAAAGTHPFAEYGERKLYPDARYRELIDRNRWIARRLMIFGLHVHVGMRDGDHAIHMNNALLHYLPIFLALSASSPYWRGEDTELASSRITIFEALPTGGHPCLVRSWQEFIDLYAALERSGAVRSVKDIWWDIRPSPGYGTIEVRICDGLPTVSETVAVVALVHAVCHWLDRRMQKGETFAAPAYWIIRENKWRASRHGVEAQMILSEGGQTQSMRAVVEELLTTLEPELPDLGYGFFYANIRRNLAHGLSYVRQKKIAQSHLVNAPLGVAQHLVREFEQNAPEF